VSSEFFTAVVSGSTVDGRSSNFTDFTFRELASCRELFGCMSVASKVFFTEVMTALASVSFSLGELCSTLSEDALSVVIFSESEGI